MADRSWLGPGRRELFVDAAGRCAYRIAGMSSEHGRWLSLAELISAIKDTSSEEKPARVVLAISGGGATGAYEAGVIRALLENLKDGLRPVAVTGSSAGAINALGWLVQQMHGGCAMPSSRTAFGYQVWETVAKRNRGGKYVVGDDFAIRALSRLSALHLGGSTGAAGERVLPADILIVAVLALVLLAANLQQFVGHPTRWPWILAAGLLCLPLMLILVLLGMVLARRAVFLNRALTSTLTNVLDANARDLLRERSDDDVHALGREWVERWATLGDGAPGFVLTGTDLTTQGEVLFSLVRPRTFAHLASEEWQVFQFDPGNAPVRPEYLAEATDATEIPQMAASGGLSFGFVAAEDFVRCVVASTSIPGVFRPQRIVLSSLDGTRKVSHDVVDGGVLNNSPIHVAIDLEATHVISLELDPLVDQGTFEAEAPAAPMDLPQNLSGTLATLLRQTTSEDIRRASSWNRHLRTPGQASQTKRLVQLYRVAPRARRLGLLDFGGHYPNFTGPPDPSLGAWLEQSYADAMTLPLFWDATFEAAPAHTPL